MTEAQPSTVEEPVEEKEEIWTYVGTRLRSGKLYYGWMDARGGIGLYAKRMCTIAIGGRATFTVYSDGRFFASGSKGPRASLDRHQDLTDLAAWQAADEVAQQSRRLKAVERKAADVEPLEELLGSIRTITQGLTWPEKRAFLSRLAEEIMGYR